VAVWTKSLIRAATCGSEQRAQPTRVEAWPVIFESVKRATVELPYATGGPTAVKCGQRYAWSITALL